MPNGYSLQVFKYKYLNFSVYIDHSHLYCVSMVTGLVLSGGATVLFSTTSSLSMFAALWFLNGFAQGAGWPACAKLLKKVTRLSCGN